MTRFYKEKMKEYQKKTLRNIRALHESTTPTFIEISEPTTLKVGAMEYPMVTVQDKRFRSVEGKTVDMVIGRDEEKAGRLDFIAKFLVHANVKSLRMLGEDMLDQINR